MASVTFTIDPATLEAARIQAKRRDISLDQVVADSLANFAQSAPSPAGDDIVEREKNRKELLELMYSNPLGDLGKLPTREEIYAERTPWPRS